MLALAPTALPVHTPLHRPLRALLVLLVHILQQLQRHAPHVLLVPMRPVVLEAVHHVQRAPTLQLAQPPVLTVPEDLTPPPGRLHALLVRLATTPQLDLVHAVLAQLVHTQPMVVLQPAHKCLRVSTSICVCHFSTLTNVTVFAFHISR